MKIIKNQYSHPITANPKLPTGADGKNHLCKQSNFGAEEKVVRSEVELQNNKLMDPQKLKIDDKRISAHPSLKNLLSKPNSDLVQHQDYTNQSLTDKKSAEGQPALRKSFVPHCTQQSVQSLSVGQHIQLNSNRGILSNCPSSQPSNKIIINHHNSQTPFHGGLRRNQTQKSDNDSINHDLPCLSAQSTLQNNVSKIQHFGYKKKESLKDQHSTKTIRLKKTVFKAPGFLKNKQTAKCEKQKRNNQSMPKDYKTIEIVCRPQDAGLHKYIEEKRAQANSFRSRKQCLSTEKNLKTESSNEQKKFKSFLKNLSCKAKDHKDRFGVGKEVKLKIFNLDDKELFAQLKIIKRLAENGPSSVYLVVQKVTGFLLCLKKSELRSAGEGPKKNTDTNQQFSSSLDSLIKESKIGMSLDHPYLIKTYCTLVDQKHIFQLMEFVEGSTLHNFNKQRRAKISSGQVEEELGVHPIKVIKQIIAELLSGIIYLHARGIVHRDLKPANIFISNNHAFKIGDYGCSIYSRPSDYVGTLDYVAPEIMMHEEHGTPVDMWAIGCIAYELYSGHTPFYHPKKSETIERIVDGVYNAEKIEDAELRDFIVKLLQRDPSSRLTAKQAHDHPFLQESGQNRLQA